jgi:hypothetical protein
MSFIKNIIRQSLLIVLLLCNTVLPAKAPIPVPAEYEVKAAFLFNFTQFVEWPPASFASDQAPLMIGILGENPFGSYLEEIVAGEKVHGHSLTINYYKNLDEIKSCNILFINKDKAGDMNNILASIKGKNILTVSDAPFFLQQGGIVRFYTLNNKISLQINLDAAKAAKLEVSSKLLRLCKIYVPE